MKLSRRAVLKSGLGLAGTVALGGRVLSTPSAWATDDGVNVRSLWQPVREVVLPRSDSLHPTLLPARTLTPATAKDAWHLYVWSHGVLGNETTDLRLFSAPTPDGFYTDEGLLLQGCPTPVPAGYETYHFDSGDIVWDAVGSRYVSTPHALRSSSDAESLGEVPQDSFLIQSTDGLTWSWLDGDNSPRLRCGPVGDPDDVHTGYGRLLRDLDGYLTKYQGSYWWIYRAQRHDTRFVDGPDGQHLINPVNNKPINLAQTLYRPWIAQAGSLAGGWNKSAGQAFVAIPQPDASLIGMGSFIKAADKFWVHYATGTGQEAVGTSNVLLGGATDPDTGLLTAKQQPTPLGPSPTDISADDPVELAKLGGGNIIRDPQSGVQYLVAVAGGTPSAGIPARAIIYRSLVD